MVLINLLIQGASKKVTKSKLNNSGCDRKLDRYGPKVFPQKVSSIYPRKFWSYHATTVFPVFIYFVACALVKLENALYFRIPFFNVIP